MKKLIIWLAKVFRVNLYVEKIVYVDKIVEKEVYVSLDGEIIGNCTVKGDLIVIGYLYVNGEVTCYKIKGE